MKEMIIDAGAIALFVIVSFFGLCATINDIVKWCREIKREHAAGHEECENGDSHKD